MIGYPDFPIIMLVIIRLIILYVYYKIFKRITNLLNKVQSNIFSSSTEFEVRRSEIQLNRLRIFCKNKLLRDWFFELKHYLSEKKQEINK